MQLLTKRELPPQGGEPQSRKKYPAGSTKKKRLRLLGAEEKPLRTKEHVEFDWVSGLWRGRTFAPGDGKRSQLISALPKNMSNFIDGWPLGQCGSGPSGTEGPMDGSFRRRQQA